ncbi:MAG: Fungal specific transcription factor [Chaenotheca gracillima]|nr:MAG: Fungal specific transcription factor [Chaenotheca gracillima]
MAYHRRWTKTVDYDVYPEDMDLSPVELEKYLSASAAPYFWRTSVLRRSWYSHDDGPQKPIISEPAHREWSVEQLLSNLRILWGTYIAFSVPLNESRDHLSLERTFLSYQRTSFGLAMLAVTVAQLLVLQHAPVTNPKFGFHIIGKPVAYALIGAAMVVTLIGCRRFWVQQSAVLRGKIQTGGWEVLLMGVAFVIGMFALFIVLIALDIDKDDIS